MFLIVSMFYNSHYILVHGCCVVILFYIGENLQLQDRDDQLQHQLPKIALPCTSKFNKTYNVQRTVYIQFGILSLWNCIMYTSVCSVAVFHYGTVLYKWMSQRCICLVIMNTWLFIMATKLLAKALFSLFRLTFFPQHHIYYMHSISFCTRQGDQ